MREKTLDEMSPHYRDLYQKGCQAADQGEYDNAIVLFNQILSDEPGFVECREALRKAQLARAQSNGFVKNTFEEMCEIPELAEAEICLRSKPLKAIRIAEEVLNKIPASTIAHKIIADAALRLRMYRTAFLSLNFIRSHGGSNNIDVNLELANALTETGDLSKGLAICGRLLKEFPNNKQVLRTLDRLSKLAFEGHTIRQKRPYHGLMFNAG